MADKVLILTAGFGDGHNTAARNLKAAVEQVSGGTVQGVVHDICKDGSLSYWDFLKWLYQVGSTRLPSVWHWLFNYAEKCDPRRLGWNWVGGVHRCLGLQLAEHQPRVVASTFLLHPHLLAQGHPGIHRPEYFSTVITDSITINRIWHTAPADVFFVTDDLSKNLLVERGIAEEKIAAPGFLVSPLFDTLAPRPVGEQIERLLFFAATATGHVEKTLTSLLENVPGEVAFTIVMGRHEARLGKMINRLLTRFPQRQFSLLGWTNQVPQLLTSHDIVITKAGGATVHECLAAGTPPLINYIIPGQEEGNAQLVEHLGSGWRFMDPEGIGPRVRDLMKNGEWRAAKIRAMETRKPDGALRAAEFLLRRAKLLP